MQALISACLHYCNADYIELPLKKLQLVQNTSSQAIMGILWYTYVTPLLHELHWLSLIKRTYIKSFLSWGLVI